MTPWKQNCPHSEDGWCIQCVSRLGDAIEKYRDNDGSRNRYDVLALEKAGIAIDLALSSNYEPDADMGRMEHDDRGHKQ